MSETAWQEANNRYLAASLAWLRLRLQVMLPEPMEAASGSAGNTSAAAKARPWPHWTPAAAFAPPSANPPPAPSAATRSGELQLGLTQALAARNAAAKAEPPPALILLARRFGLSDFERDILLLCVAQELDPSAPGLCAQVQHGASYPSYSLALAALGDASWEALSPHRPLRYSRLIEVSTQPGTPLTASALKADERVVNFVKGLNVPDERLMSLLVRLDEAQEPALSESQQAQLQTLADRLQALPSTAALPLIQLQGPDADSKRALAIQLCTALGRRLYRLTSEALPTATADVEVLARLWQRESVLLPVALYVDTEQSESLPAELNNALQRFLARDLGLVFVSVRETPLKTGGECLLLDVRMPTATEQRAAWQAQLGEAQAEAAAALAGQFDLNLRQIAHLAAEPLHESEGEQVQQALWARCRELTRPKLDQLAQRLDCKASWDDVVLPEEPATLLRQISSQVRERHRVFEHWGFAARMNRGMGISALFAGESGTGKTMAAEVIANDLQLNLYRIDLSAVVSKYIGETEKNLRKVFDAAERGGAILFFDEADALFGKRSEVKDSHDRYANIEINYLLQRMEAFSGLAVLATNMKSALDTAFMRRLRFVVQFPFPGVKERRLMWQKALPPETPSGVLDYERLARLNISGGNIHSIALNAAFLAAAQNGTVTMPLVLAAARTEMKKLDKAVNEAEFRL